MISYAAEAEGSGAIVRVVHEHEPVVLGNLAGSREVPVVAGEKRWKESSSACGKLSREARQHQEHGTAFYPFALTSCRPAAAPENRRRERG